MPICRAAFGALEKHNCGALYFAMEKDSAMGGAAPSRRAWRWAREIAIAVLLTLAAAGFIIAALLHGNSMSKFAPSFETARKPAGH